MTSEWAFRQHNIEPENCTEEGCVRPPYDGLRCKLHADIAAYRDRTSGESERSLPDSPTEAGVAR